MKLNVHIYVTPVCNIHCKHCYYDAVQKADESNMLTYTELQSILTEVSSNYDADFHVEGGELFLRRNIASLFENLELSVLKQITITSNGTIDLMPHIHYLKNINCLRLSVCGHTDEMQQSLRQIDLAPVLKNIRVAVKEKLQLTLRMTLQKRYYEILLRESLNFFYKEENVKNFSLYEYQSVGRGKEFDEQYLLSNDDCEKIISILDCLNWEGMNVSISLTEQRRQLVEQYEDKLIKWGYEVEYLPKEQSLTINYDGTMGICAWNVGNDVIGKYTTDIESVIKDVDLYHSCEHCSSIVIRKKSCGKTQ